MDKDKKEVKSRRERTLMKIGVLGIDHCEWLPLIEGYEIIKTEEQICKRFLASFFSAMLACDFSSDHEFFETEGREIINSFIERYNVQDALYPDEKKILTGECDERLAVNVSWTVESSYTLMWVLGFVTSEELEAPGEGCDTNAMVKFVQQFESFEEFRAACKMRTASEILDMIDLYYNIHWACVDHRLNPKTNCGEFNEEVVMERRKALEWIISEENDWNEISLDT